MSELPYFSVFGYGSLMFQPELPDEVLGRAHAVLRGHHRAFNKRSSVRGCPLSERRWPDAVPVPADFVQDGIQHSLCLGTEADPSSALHGMVLRYDPVHRATLLCLLDKREGFHEHAAPSDNSYARVTVQVSAEGHQETALTYLGEPASHLYRPLPLPEQARILIAATPRPGGRSRGLDYLLDTRAVLQRGGIEDPHIEALIAAVGAIEGPWTALL